MRDPRERRRNPRLRLSYPIHARVSEPGQVGSARAVTTNLGARGAYFKTFAWEPFRVGQKVSVRIRVPHGISSGDHQVDLDLETEGTVCRMDRVEGLEALGEDGVALKGVALVFHAPLEFKYLWS